MAQNTEGQSKDCVGCPKGGFKTMCGGQALIEGIMMRGPKKQAIVVRRQDGAFEIQEKELKLVKERYPICGAPLIRGVVTFLDSMICGMQALMWSAEFFPEDEDSQPSKLDLWLEKKLGSQKLTTLVATLAAVLGIGLSLFLFFLLPTLLGGVVDFIFPGNMFVRNLSESLLKIVIFIAYLAMCSRMKDMRRVFQYHGAEHKTIFCYEAGLPLTVENVRGQSCHHPRCGTSFLFVVIFVSILVSTAVFSIWPVYHPLLRFLAHLVMLPMIVGVSYEFNRYVGRHDTPVTRVLMAPGLWLQNFTTFEPDDSMIEVGIKALQLVLPEEKGSDRW